MNLIFRTILQLIRSRRRPALAITDVGRAPFRTLLTDIDVLGHMNNGVYLSIMDLGRMDLMIREGFWAKLRAAKMYPVMVSETITFRKSLSLWQRFTAKTKTQQLWYYDGLAKRFTQRAKALKDPGLSRMARQLRAVVDAVRQHKPGR